jgi:hypothetical protein
MLIMIVLIVRTHSLSKAREVKNIMEEAIRMMTLGGIGKEEDKVEKGRRVRRRVEGRVEKVEEIERLGKRVEDKVEKVEGSLHLSSDVREYIVKMIIKRNYSKPRRKLESLGYTKVRIMKRRDKIIVEADGGREIIDVGKYMGDQKR